MLSSPISMQMDDVHYVFVFDFVVSFLKVKGLSLVKTNLCLLEDVVDSINSPLALTKKHQTYVIYVISHASCVPLPVV